MDRHQSKRGQTAPATSAEASVDRGCEGPTPQPDRHASQFFGRAFGSCSRPRTLHGYPYQGQRGWRHPGPHSWQDSSVVTWRWWSRSTRVQRVQVIFGSRQLQPDQPVGRAYKLILAAGCPSSTFGAGNLLSFFWHWSALGGPG